MTAALSPDIVALARQQFHWDAWQHLIEANGIVIDRPYGSRHPRYPEIIYPIDYGYVRDTSASDDEELDIFVGSGDTGLVGGILTADFRRGDHEMKLIYNCSPEEIYLVNGFINFDMSLMMGRLVLRRTSFQ